jgi:NTE family protein
MYGAGHDSQTMAERMERLSGTNLLNINVFSQRARQQRVRDELNQGLRGLSFRDLKIPLVITAVDMLSGAEVILSEGNLVQALLASSAVPAVFPPVKIDGMELADGGVIDSVATHVAFRYNPHIVIDQDNPWTDPLSAIMGMNIPIMSGTLPWATSPNPVSSLWRAVRVMTWHLHQERLRAHPPHVLLRPPVGETGSLDFSDTQAPYFAGVQETQEHLGEILALVDRLVPPAAKNDDLNQAKSSA